MLSSWCCWLQYQDLCTDASLFPSLFPYSYWRFLQIMDNDIRARKNYNFSSYKKRTDSVTFILFFTSPGINHHIPGLANFNTTALILYCIELAIVSFAFFSYCYKTYRIVKVDSWRQQRKRKCAMRGLFIRPHFSLG